MTEATLRDTVLSIGEQAGAAAMAVAVHDFEHHILRPIRRICDPFTFRLIGAVMGGRSPSLLDLEDRPPEYEDVGKLCAWDTQAPPAQVGRSRYERVVLNAVAGQRLRRNGHSLRPVGMSGWSAIVFRREDQRREVVAIDDLIVRLDGWEQQ